MVSGREVWLTSDLHLGHKKVAGLRGFSSTAEHDETIIDNWNGVVGPNDTVYVLGDFSFLPRLESTAAVCRLNGAKHLLLGNHDGTRARCLSYGFSTVEHQTVIEYLGVRLWLAHIPSCGDNERPKLRRPAPMAAYDIEVCGHVHESWLFGPNGQVNVALEATSLTPISIPDVVRRYQHHMRGGGNSLADSPNQSVSSKELS